MRKILILVSCELLQVRVLPSMVRHDTFSSVGRRNIGSYLGSNSSYYSTLLNSTEVYQDLRTAP